MAPKFSALPLTFGRKCPGFTLAQKFRKKWLLPPGKIGRSFTGQERSYRASTSAFVLNIFSWMWITFVVINILLYKIFIDSKGIFFYYLPRLYFLLIHLHVTDANYSWKLYVNFIWMAPWKLMSFEKNNVFSHILEGSISPQSNQNTY